MMSVKIMLAVCMLVIRAKADSVSSRELCPGRFLVVGESRFCCSLSSCRMLIVVMMGKWSDDSAC